MADTPGGQESPDSSVQLLARIRAGDTDALNRLMARHLPALQRWARGRLPVGVRDLEDTADLVQESVIQALKHLDHFEYRREGALQAYLRQAVYNRIRMEFRRKRSRPALRASTKAGISAGSFCPSPSSVATHSARAARIPVITARL